MLNKQNIIICLPCKQDGDEPPENGNSHCTTTRSKTRLLALPEKERERAYGDKIADMSFVILLLGRDKSLLQWHLYITKGLGTRKICSL